MDSVEVRHLYTSASCNRHQNALDFGNDLVVYGSSCALIVYDYKLCSIKNVLCEHKSQLNTVRWIEKDKSLISSSNDCTALIWELTGSDDHDFKPIWKLICQSSVITANAIRLAKQHFLAPFGEYLSLTATNDQTLSIWINDTKVNEMKTQYFVFDCRLIVSWFLENVVILLAASDSFIHLCSLNSDKQLNLLCKLAGHEDWVRSIDVMFWEDSLLIASGAQDNFIRVWKLVKTDEAKTNFYERYFVIENSCVSFTTETVLVGHEEWVYSVKWIQSRNHVLRLLSSSMDKAMVLWEKPKEQNELWIEKVRVGDVGGNSLGFLGSSASIDGSIIMGHSFNGALHIWSCNNDNDEWEPGIIIGGHFGAVKDIAWEPFGRYLISCSLDETSRLHSLWLSNNSWHEISRPQIHGYELNCIAFINPLLFVSGADEKVLRVFGATKCFLRNIENISKFSVTGGDNLAEFATVPALGLSNKAMSGEQIESDSFFKAVVLEKPPTEDNLMQNTLWPEVQKLYGHVFELFAVAVNHKGTIIASASKATKEEYASIILWDTKNNYKQFQRLPFHQLTVTQICFSPNDRFLLTVSRDRTWCLYECDEQCEFRRVAFSDKKTGVHSRIIWDAAWTADSLHFITVSRDKKAVVWRIESDSSDFAVKPCSEYTAIDAITSVDVDTRTYGNIRNLIAIGLENGQVSLFLWTSDEGWNNVYNLDNCHHLAISRVRFSPRNGNEMDETKLATCATDRMVRIFSIRVR